MFYPDVSVLEKIIRAALVYVFLLLAFKLFGRRQFAQLTTFDFVVLLIISNVVQNAMIGKDDSITGGLIGASTILGLNWVVAEAAFRSQKAERMIEGVPRVLIHHGRIVEKNLAKERISREELYAALRRQGIGALDEVKTAILEASGGLSVIQQEDSLKKG